MEQVWPYGRGEMVERIRAHDWASTPLGPSEGWSAELKAIVGLVLASPVVSTVALTADRLLLYNDAAARLYGAHHPGALGRPLGETFPDSYPTVASFYDRVFAGESVQVLAQPLVVGTGGANEIFDAYLSPVRDSAGAVIGAHMVGHEIGEQFRRDASLRASEQRFRAFVTASADAIYRMSSDWSEMCELDGRGFLADAVRPTAAWMEHYIPPEDQPAVRAAIDAAIRAKAKFELEHRVVRSDGTFGWTASRAVPILNEHGDIKEWLGTATDISPRREADERFRTMADNVPALIWETDESGAISVNDHYLDFFGVPLGELLGMGWVRFIHPDDAAEYMAAYRHAFEQRKPFYHECRVLRADGRYRWLRISGNRVGENRFVGASIDVTDLLEAQRGSQESEERLRQFGEASQDVLWIRDAATFQWEYLTPAFETIYGLDREAALSGDNMAGWLELIIPEDRERASESLERVRAGAWVTFEYRIRRPADGAIRWLRNTDFPIRNANGEVAHIGGIGHDITEVKRTEEALASAERRQRALVEGMPQLVWRAVDGGEWTWASPQWSEYCGQAEEESHGWGWLAPLHPDDRDLARAAWSNAAERGGLDAEYRIRHALDGEYRWFHTRASPVRDEHDAIVEWLGTSTDIHDLRDLQSRQQVLVAELQHRTRNLMGVIRSMSDKTARASADLSDFRARFRDRLEALARVQGLLSRLTEHDRVTFDELIAAELGALNGDAAKVIVEGPPGVRLRSSMVQTLALAIHELATNAVKYGALGQPGGRLAVTWSLRPGAADERPWLHIDWRESGVVMPPASSAGGRGQGRELIERALPYQLSASTTYALGPDGVHCTIAIPVSTTAAPKEIEHA